MKIKYITRIILDLICVIIIPIIILRYDINYTKECEICVYNIDTENNIITTNKGNVKNITKMKLIADQCYLVNLQGITNRIISDIYVITKRI